MKLEYTIKSRIWISTEVGTFLGEGRINLLKKIDECGSISKAAKVMGMSYKKAWDLVNSMNSNFNQPLVIVAVGGLNGGGSSLSDKGKELVKVFCQLERNNTAFLQNELNKIEVLK